MSLSHAQKYYDLVSQDTALLESLSAGTKSEDEFMARVVADAKKNGLEFSTDEAKQYLDQESAEKADGELSGQQLEAVAGGKGPRTKGLFGGRPGYSVYNCNRLFGNPKTFN